MSSITQVQIADLDLNYSSPSLNLPVTCAGDGGESQGYLSAGDSQREFPSGCSSTAPSAAPARLPALPHHSRLGLWPRSGISSVPGTVGQSMGALQNLPVLAEGVKHLLVAFVSMKVREECNGGCTGEDPQAPCARRLQHPGEQHVDRQNRALLRLKDTPEGILLHPELPVPSPRMNPLQCPGADLCMKAKQELSHGGTQPLGSGRDRVAPKEGRNKSTNPVPKLK